MFVAASYWRGTAHFMSCPMEEQWFDKMLKEFLLIREPANRSSIGGVRFMQVESFIGILASKNK